ncbi:hypothetical protein DBY21_10035, partial [Candidatus Gastranaerophilales bacterium]
QETGGRNGNLIVQIKDRPCLDLSPGTYNLLGRVSHWYIQNMSTKMGNWNATKGVMYSPENFEVVGGQENAVNVEFTEEPCSRPSAKTGTLVLTVNTNGNGMTSYDINIGSQRSTGSGKWKDAQQITIPGLPTGEQSLTAKSCMGDFGGSSYTKGTVGIRPSSVNIPANGKAYADIDCNQGGGSSQCIPTTATIRLQPQGSTAQSGWHLSGSLTLDKAQPIDISVGITATMTDSSGDHTCTQVFNIPKGSTSKVETFPKTCDTTSSPKSVSGKLSHVTPNGCVTSVKVTTSDIPSTKKCTITASYGSDVDFVSIGNIDTNDWRDGTSRTFDCGTRVAVAGYAGTCYDFFGRAGNKLGKSDATTYQLTLDQDTQVTVKACTGSGQKWTLTLKGEVDGLSNSGGSNCSSSSAHVNVYGAGDYDDGTTAIMTTDWNTNCVLQGNAKKSFDGWYNGGTRVSTNKKYSITMKKNETYTAKWVVGKQSSDPTICNVNLSSSSTGNGEQYTFTVACTNAPFNYGFELSGNWHGSTQNGNPNYQQQYHGSGMRVSFLYQGTLNGQGVFLEDFYCRLNLGSTQVKCNYSGTMTVDGANVTVKTTNSGVSDAGERNKIW